MKLAVPVLAVLAVVADVTSAAETDCRDFSVDNCPLEFADVIIGDVSEAKCQEYCDSYFDDICAFFVYERPKRLCQLYDDEDYQGFLDDCRKVAGPPEPSVDTCVNSNVRTYSRFSLLFLHPI